MSYKGPHRAVAKNLQREDGRYTGAVLECGHEVTYQRTQGKPSEHSFCSQCIGSDLRKIRKAGAPLSTQAAPIVNPPPVRSLEQRVQDLEKALASVVAQLDGHGPVPPARPAAAAVPRSSAEVLDVRPGIDDLRRLEESLELWLPVKDAVVRLFRTERASTLHQHDFEEALEAVERAARQAGWFDDAGERSRVPGSGDPAARARGPGRAGPGRAGPGRAGPGLSRHGGKVSGRKRGGRLPRARPPRSGGLASARSRSGSSGRNAPRPLWRRTATR